MQGWTMPWCDTCDAYLTPNTVEADGTCPTCHDEVDDADTKLPAPEEANVPWHFWVVVVALVAYLGWRAIVGVAWLIERF
ncbi:MAG: hypothetical protein AAFO29_17725 [Actinomycetota bacterium]